MAGAHGAHGGQHCPIRTHPTHPSTQPRALGFPSPGGGTPVIIWFIDLFSYVWIKHFKNLNHQSFIFSVICNIVALSSRIILVSAPHSPGPSCGACPTSGPPAWSGRGWGGHLSFYTIIIHSITLFCLKRFAKNQKYYTILISLNHWNPIHYITNWCTRRNIIYWGIHIYEREIVTRLNDNQFMLAASIFNSTDSITDTITYSTVDSQTHSIHSFHQPNLNHIPLNFSVEYLLSKHNTQSKL